MGRLARWFYRQFEGKKNKYQNTVSGNQQIINKVSAIENYWRLATGHWYA